MKRKKICLIGPGRLGSHLCSALIESKNFDLTLCSRNKPAFAGESGAFSYKFLDVLNLSGDVSFLNDQEIIIYLVPPTERIPQDFFQLLKRNQKIIFASSISIYGKNAGKVQEDSPLSKEMTSSPFLFEMEAYLKRQFSHLTCLRLGGLYGFTKHPLYFLSGKKLNNGDEYVHLVHYADCVQAIMAIIEKDIFGETFNVVYPLQMSKKEYYEFMATRLGVVPPLYSDFHQSEKRTKISNQKSLEKLNMTYQNPCDYIKE